MSILFWRRLSQGMVAAAFIAIPVLNRHEINYLSGNFLSFNFVGLPLADPLAVAQAAAGSGGVTAAMLTGAGLTLLLAVLMGTVFCSWICPYGLLSELVHPKRPQGFDTKKAAKASARPFLARLGFALAGLALVGLLVPVPFLNQFSMPGWYSRAFQYAVLYGGALLGGVIAVPAVLILERMSGRRFWCRYCCPQSVLISLAGALIPARWRIRFDKKRCTCAASDRACLAACSLGLDPRHPNLPQRLQCTNCGDCVDACKGRGNALRFGAGGRERQPSGGQERYSA